MIIGLIGFTTADHKKKCPRGQKPRNQIVCIPDDAAEIKCRHGQHVEYDVIYCIKAPCPAPIPKCVPDKDCPCGKHLECHDVECVRAPCPAICSCVDDDCPDGQIRECKDVVCIRAPCPPECICVPIKTKT